MNTSKRSKRFELSTYDYVSWFKQVAIGTLAAFAGVVLIELPELQETVLNTVEQNTNEGSAGTALVIAIVNAAFQWLRKFLTDYTNA